MPGNDSVFLTEDVARLTISYARAERIGAAARFSVLAIFVIFASLRRKV